MFNTPFHLVKIDETAGSTAETSSTPPYAALAAFAAAHVHETYPRRRRRRYGIVVVGQRVCLPDRRDPAEAAPAQTPAQTPQGRIGISTLFFIPN